MSVRGDLKSETSRLNGVVLGTVVVYTYCYCTTTGGGRSNGESSCCLSTSSNSVGRPRSGRFCSDFCSFELS